MTAVNWVALAFAIVALLWGHRQHRRGYELGRAEARRLAGLGYANLIDNADYARARDAAYADYRRVR